MCQLFRNNEGKVPWRTGPCLGREQMELYLKPGLCAYSALTQGLHSGRCCGGLNMLCPRSSTSKRYGLAGVGVASLEWVWP